jgi:hypothetical protein
MVLQKQTKAQSNKAPVNPRRQELETAEEILAEVFGARPF